MATYYDIELLCWNAKNLRESELILRLRSTKIHPEALGGRNGRELLRIAVEGGRSPGFLKVLHGLLHGLDPNVLATTDERGFTLLHFAVDDGRSPGFLKVLHGLDPSLVKTRDNHGRLPVHLACSLKNIDAAACLVEIYPESINIATSTVDGQLYPLHLFLKDIREGCNWIKERKRFLKFLLKHDAGAFSTPNGCGDLPLHYATRLYSMHLVKPLFNAYPEGIFIENEQGKTPLDCARCFNERYTRVASFLESQGKLVSQAIKELIRFHWVQLNLS